MGGTGHLVQSPERPRGLHFPALFTDKPLSSSMGGRGRKQVPRWQARGWACAWPGTVSEECQALGAVALKTPAPSRGF